MAWVARSKGVMALAWGGALLLALANGCGSSSEKKAVRPVGDAGAAGEAGSPASDAGASGTPSAGAAGEAGVGGAQAGAGGDSSEAGAGGLGQSPECTPSGLVSGLTTSNEAIYQACRGAFLHVPVSTETGSEFTCCGTSSAVAAWSAVLSGAVDDGTGELVFQVPADAPLGSQGLAVVCASGPTANSIGLEVNEGAPPVVSGVTASIFPSENLTITGTGLTGVTSAYAASPAGGVHPCNLHSDGTDTQLVCDFDGAIPPSDPNTFYRLFVSSAECGFAVATPQFRVIQPTF